MRSFYYALLLLTGVFISSISQVMLKKAALKNYDNPIKEYLNPLVIFAYVLFVGTTFLSVFAYKGIPLSMGPVLEATSYIYVTFWGVRIFGEKINKKKILAITLILLGIIIYSFM
ncbi:EamA-like transporter family protein [Lachnospiraceae bacterium]|nr:EamA-like transporter family protein [Lachnospiraceae bacterium]